MRETSFTLQTGERAPAFSLKAANRFTGNLPQGFTLRGLLARGPLILEFLRGTW
jgi:hypothetical protein